MKKNNEILSKYLAAIEDGDKTTADAVIKRAANRAISDVEALVCKYAPADYPFLVAVLLTAAHGIEKTFDQGGVEVAQYLAERMKVTAITASGCDPAMNGRDDNGTLQNLPEQR